MKIKNIIFKIILCILSIGLFSMVYYEWVPSAYHFYLYLSVMIFCSIDSLFLAIRGILQKQKDFSSLFVLIAAIVTFYLQFYKIAIFSLLIHSVLKMISESVVNGKKKKMSQELDYRNCIVHVKRSLGYVDEIAKNVVAGDELEVRLDELLPVDAVCSHGETQVTHLSFFDKKESSHITVGSTVFSGSVNLGAPIRVTALTDFDNARSQRVYQKYLSNMEKDHSSEVLFKKLSGILTAVGIFFSGLIALVVPAVSSASYLSELPTAMVLFSISCSSYIYRSVSLCYFWAHFGLTCRGILIKNKSYLDVFQKIRQVVFDKTGTLTEGVFRVKEYIPHNGVTKKELLHYATLAESCSNHPVAKAIMHEYGEFETQKKIEQQLEVPGEGICVYVNGVRIYVGNYHLMERAAVRYLPYYSDGVAIYVASENKYYGCIVLKDEIRDSSFRAVRALYKMGVSTITMLTGDKKNNAENAAANLGLQRYFAELLPQQKAEQMKHIVEKNRAGGMVAFVGDGVNDAASLMAADIGFAMSDHLSDESLQTADVVLCNNDPFGVAYAMQISLGIRRVITKNIILSLILKISLFSLAVMNLLPLFVAVFADAICELVLISNALRVCKIKKEKE